MQQGAGLTLNQAQLNTPYLDVRASSGIDLRGVDAQGNFAGSLGNQINETMLNVQQGLGPAGSVGVPTYGNVQQQTQQQYGQQAQQQFDNQNIQQIGPNAYVSTNNFFSGYN